MSARVMGFETSVQCSLHLGDLDHAQTTCSRPSRLGVKPLRRRPSSGEDDRAMVWSSGRNGGSSRASSPIILPACLKLIKLNTEVFRALLLEPKHVGSKSSCREGNQNDGETMLKERERAFMQLMDSYSRELKSKSCNKSILCVVDRFLHSRRSYDRSNRRGGSLTRRYRSATIFSALYLLIPLSTYFSCNRCADSSNERWLGRRAGGSETCC